MVILERCRAAGGCRAFQQMASPSPRSEEEELQGERICSAFCLCVVEQSGKQAAPFHTSTFCSVPGSDAAP